MNYTQRFLSWIVAAAMAVGCGNADSPTTQPSGSSTPAATLRLSAAPVESALHRFRNAPTPALLKPLGLANADELARAKPGLELPVRMIRLDGLQSFSLGANPDDLLLDIRSRATLLTVDDEVRSLFYIAEYNGDWVMSRAGGAPYARQVAEAVTRATRRGIDPSTMLLVEARGFSQSFVGFRVGDVLMLQPVGSDGEARPASETLAALAAHQSALHQNDPGTNNQVPSVQAPPAP